MTARDDYPLIGKFWKDQAVHRQAHDALNEIDRLRGRSRCGECGGPLVSRCDDCGTVHG